MDDSNAISRLKQGDLNGLEILVNRYQVRALHAAYLVVYDRDVAEDIVQTAFVKVAERIHQFDGVRPFAPWFFRIVLNDAIKAAKRRDRSISLDEEVEEDSHRFAAWLLDPTPSPGQLVEGRELRQQILDAIESLTPEQRAVIVMRYYLDWSEADMSRKMDRPLSTIKWWLREARKRLRSLMEATRIEDARSEHGQ
jgi:RNA polymerase sigma-70 factor (ECF subfamily)